MMTQARHSHGTRRVLFTVASFRIWRGSQVYAARDPAISIIFHNIGPLASPRGGIQLRYSGLRI